VQVNIVVDGMIDVMANGLCVSHCIWLLHSLYIGGRGRAGAGRRGKSVSLFHCVCIYIYI